MPQGRSGAANRHVRRKLIDKLWAAQDGCCAYCFGRFRYEPGDPYAPANFKVTLEHVVPWQLGGRNFANRILAHGCCNRRKGGRMPTGCELIILEAVNARLGITPEQRAWAEKTAKDGLSGRRRSPAPSD